MKPTGIINERKPEHEINEIFLNRWSPRAMSGDKISKKEILPLFEAAKWAPSSGNEQPWRFIYALKETGYFNEFFFLLDDGNKRWGKNAGALIIVLSKNVWDDDGSELKTHSFDTGAAWENLALQGSLLGLVVHGMAGFDYNKARELLNLPKEYTVEMIIALGKPGEVENLDERDKKREFPKGRKPLKNIAFEGRLKL